MGSRSPAPEPAFAGLQALYGRKRDVSG